MEPQIERIAPNFTKVVMCGKTVWFSYSTMVAFRDHTKGETVCIENLWAQTTGKHLNTIQPDHKKRVNQETFNRLAKEAGLIA
jgi:hypothetical protein